MRCVSGMLCGLSGGALHLRVRWEDHEDVVQYLSIIWVVDRDNLLHNCSKLSEGRSKVGGVTGVGGEHTNSKV